MNLPNKLTLLRILLIPLFAFFAAAAFPGARLAAGLVFAAASFTDFLDGYIARKRGLVTDFGKFADPLADKILTTTAFIYMMRDGACAALALAVMLAREFAVSGVRMVAASAPKGKVIAAGLGGKIKTVLQMFTVIFYYCGLGAWQLVQAEPADGGFFHTGALALCWAAALVTAVSGAQYIWASRQYINTVR